MFCKASVLKCPGPKKKGKLTLLCLQSRVFPVQWKTLKSTPCAPRPHKDTVACWLKLEQSAPAQGFPELLSHESPLSAYVAL